MSIEDLPVGTNLISFSRTETGRGIEYVIEAEQSGWSFVLKGNPPPGAKYYLNGSPVALTSSGIRMNDRRNLVLVVP